jgi:hypothetical protein
LRYFPAGIGNSLQTRHLVGISVANYSISGIYEHFKLGHHQSVHCVPFSRNEPVFVGSFYNFGALDISTLFSMVYKLDNAHFSQKRREPLHFGVDLHFSLRPIFICNSLNSKLLRMCQKTGHIVARKWLYPSQTAKTVRSSKNVKLSRKKDKNMKKYSAIIAAVAAIALCSNAKANVITIPGTTGGSLQITSTYTLSAGEYTYTYVVAPGTGSQYDEVSVFFPTALAAIINETGTAQAGTTLTPTLPTPPYDVNYHWSAEQSGSETVSFQSPYAPVVGSIGAQDTTTYPETSGVWVPNVPSVPDGGLTLAMIGCVFMGIAGIRSRLGKRA